ncbi:MAG: hypothetical protein ACJ8FG_02845, partial [Sphingomicrobium sp.]
MHWLDAERSLEIDPVLDCLTYLAREADRPSSPVLLRAGLALADDGTLPFHQIEPALDQVGMRAEPVVRRLKGWPSRKLPAVLELTEERAAVLLEIRDSDALVYAPGVAELNWIKLAELEPIYTGRAVVVEAECEDDAEREHPQGRDRLVRDDPVVDVHREQRHREGEQVDDEGG